jgi:protein phosphatase
MSPSLLDYGAGTNTGLVRENNEDCYLARPDIGLWLVADGMGGHDAGEVASSITRDYINTALGKGISLKQAIAQSHHAVKQAAENNIGSPNMGTTVVALRITGIQYEIAWVGDSRAYLWDKRQLSQLSTDHSYVQELMESGAISKEEMINHSQKNVITQSIGVSHLKEVNVGVINGLLEPGQKILLCSDGLNDLVDDATIESILARSYESNQDLVDRLIAKALKNGGTDNVTVQLISAASQDSFRDEIHRALLQSPLAPLFSRKPFACKLFSNKKYARWLSIILAITLAGLIMTALRG